MKWRAGIKIRELRYYRTHANMSGYYRYITGETLGRQITLSTTCTIGIL